MVQISRSHGPMLSTRLCARWWWLLNGVSCFFMIWIGFSSPMERSLTGNIYLQILGDHLQQFTDFMYPNNDEIFMDDNALCHRTTVVCDWFEELSRQFERMIWPRRSPNMNPIERLWLIIDNSCTKFCIGSTFMHTILLLQPPTHIMGGCRSGMAQYFCRGHSRTC